jgi:glycerophosphoryl diester phosphodiesterase
MFFFLGTTTVFLLVVFPERTVNRVFRDVSNIEFRLLAEVSSWFPQKSDSDGPYLTLCSHRGIVEEGSAENSFQSIEEALKKGFCCLEVDISFSSDFKPYVFHGPELGLVALEGRFSNYSSQEIEQFRLKNGQPIIPLGELCRKYGKNYRRIYLDIKGDDTNYKIKAKMLCKTIENFEIDHLVLIGYPWKVIKAVKSELPGVSVGFEQKGAIVNYLLGADMVSLYYKYEFSYAEYKLARFLGLNVLIWTINDLNLLEEISKIYKITALTDLKNPQVLTQAGILWH